MSVSKNIKENKKDAKAVEGSSSDAGAMKVEVSTVTAAGRSIQAKDWCITISVNDPNRPGVTRSSDDVEAVMKSLNAVAYVFQEEKGKQSTESNEDGYLHYQCFVQLRSPARFTTLKRRFADAEMPDVHLERREGTVQGCIDYCSKSDTHVAGPWSHGTFRKGPGRGKRTDLVRLRDEVMEGNSVDDILLADDGAKAARYLNYLDRLTQARRNKEYGHINRSVFVGYLYGDAGVGKTSSIFRRYGPENVYRIAEYSRSPFDGYDGQFVLLMDEFDSVVAERLVPFELMLNLLDVFPMTLPARYHNKVAAYTTVWIVSNLPIEQQYVGIRGEQRRALMRRIDVVAHMLPDGSLHVEQMPKKASQERLAKARKGQADLLPEPVEKAVEPVVDHSVATPAENEAIMRLLTGPVTDQSKPKSKAPVLNEGGVDEGRFNVKQLSIEDILDVEDQ
ncbi:hypothetical protein OZX72_08525 [Bifidobacterium sp. ESL0769]|uniref:hypothetical protein n=1 Tax=Bifidobacterium sp. ESL0769 TaxID=2983229 RepID=UPI0023F7B6B0|nr:hypothetical protein [Bifidobacterium sp. ESL0769]WEV67265.1 hypothetical protein OZX72_08525 [Bifidobacterium sp. ESL0769]